MGYTIFEIALKIVSTLLCHSLDLKKKTHFLIELSIANVKQIIFNNLDVSRI